MADLPADQLAPLLQSTQDALVVVKFGAPWCRPCEHIKPDFLAYEGECRQHGSSVRCASVNIDDLDDPDQYDIEHIPLFVAWFRREELGRVTTSSMAGVRELVEEAYRKASSRQ